jgi:hypothetical protein
MTNDQKKLADMTPEERGIAIATEVGKAGTIAVSDGESKLIAALRDADVERGRLLGAIEKLTEVREVIVMMGYPQAAAAFDLPLAELRRQLEDVDEA